MSPDASPAEAEKNLPEWDTAISADWQQRYLKACDTDPALFGTLANPSILCTDCLLGLRKSKVRLDQVIQLGQRLTQLKPVPLEETLHVRGRVTNSETTKAGARTSTPFEFLGTGGEPFVTAETVTLAASPDAYGSLSVEDAAEPSDLVLRRRKLLTPPKVQSYSEETGTRIHFDPAYSVRYGLRAPVAPGLMAVSWAIELLVADGPVESFEINASFGAPLFWDDGVDLLAKPGSGRPAVMHLVSSSGALTAAVRFGKSE